MSNHPDDRPMTGREPTQPRGMGTAQGEAPLSGPHDDPAGWGNAPGGHREPATTAPDAAYADVRDTAPHEERGRRHPDHDQSAMDDAVRNLAQPDNRAKLLMAIAFMVALTLLITLGLLIERLTADDGPEPVLVEGVPCLVQEGPEDAAVLYCQR